MNTFDVINFNQFLKYEGLTIICVVCFYLFASLYVITTRNKGNKSLKLNRTTVHINLRVKV